MTFPEMILDQLSSALLLGSERNRSALITSESPLGSALSEINHEIAEENLLDRLSLTTLYCRSGKQEQKRDGIAIMPSPDETTPECSKRAASMIEIMISGSMNRLIPEALTAIAKNQSRTPHYLLPQLLDLGTTRVNLRNLIASVIGERGKWLSGLNPEWSYVAEFANGTVAIASGESTEVIFESWSTLSRPARKEQLRQIRLQNPRLGRDLVQRTWKDESASDRETLLSELIAGLSMDDHPLLQEARFDRSQVVRKTAIDLLKRLESSDLVTDGTAIAESYLAVETNLLGIKRFAVLPPDLYSDDWRSFGIDRTSWIAELGDRGWYLAQWVGLVPPEHWHRRFGLNPSQLIALAERSEWEDALIIGWSIASRSSPDPEWNYQLLKFWTVKQDPRTSISQLWPAINDLGPRADDLLLELLKIDRGPLNDRHIAMRLLLNYHGPWRDDLSIAVVDRIHRVAVEVKPQAASSWLTQSLLTECAYSISPKLLNMAIGLFAADVRYSQNWVKVIDDFISALSFRSDLHKELLQ